MKKIEAFYYDTIYKGVSVFNLMINKVFKPATKNSNYTFLIFSNLSKHSKK